MLLVAVVPAGYRFFPQLKGQQIAAKRLQCPPFGAVTPDNLENQLKMLQ